MSNFSDDGWGSPVKPATRIVENGSSDSKSESPPSSTILHVERDTNAPSTVSDLDGNIALNSMKIYLNNARCRHGPIETTLLALENNIYDDLSAKEIAEAIEKSVEEINGEAKDILHRLDVHLANEKSADPKLVDIVRCNANKIFEVSAIHIGRLQKFMERNNPANRTATPQSMQTVSHAAPQFTQGTNNISPQSTQTINHSARIQLSANKIHNGSTVPNGTDPTIFGFVGMLEQINQLVGTMGQNRPAAAAALHINMIKGLVDILAETGEKLIALRDNYSKFYT